MQLSDVVCRLNTLPSPLLSAVKYSWITLCHFSFMSSNPSKLTMGKGAYVVIYLSFILCYHTIHTSLSTPCTCSQYTDPGTHLTYSLCLTTDKHANIRGQLIFTGMVSVELGALLVTFNPGLIIPSVSWMGPHLYTHSPLHRKAPLTHTNHSNLLIWTPSWTCC